MPNVGQEIDKCLNQPVNKLIGKTRYILTLTFLSEDFGQCHWKSHTLVPRFRIESKSSWYISTAMCIWYWRKLKEVS